MQLPNASWDPSPRSGSQRVGSLKSTSGSSATPKSGPSERVFRYAVRIAPFGLHRNTNRRVDAGQEQLGAPMIAVKLF